MKKVFSRSAASLLLLTAFASISQASLTNSYQFNGNGNWSIDGVGSNDTPVGTLQAYVPTGSTVVQAFLYSSFNNGSSGDITFDGTLLSASTFTALGTNSANLSAYRTDVTSEVASKIGSGSDTRFNFAINSEANNFADDGEVLVVIYSNASEANRTIALLDGFSNPAGDSFKVNLASPLIDPTTPGFQAQLSLGIGFSYQSGSNQSSTIDVNGRRLTSWAGGEDDGGSYNGGLITVGGLDDSLDNPADPFAQPVGNPRYDDELYNLAQGNGVDSTPFLSTGLTSFTVNTQNASGDDNIFFAGVNITAVAGVNQAPPPVNNVPVPEPSTYGLIGAGALLAVAARRRFKSKK